MTETLPPPLWTPPAEPVDIDPNLVAREAIELLRSWTKEPSEADDFVIGVAVRTARQVFEEAHKKG